MSPLAFWLWRRRHAEVRAKAGLAADLVSSHGGGNSRRAQARVRSTFAPALQPWTWCHAHRYDTAPDFFGVDRPLARRCQLRRGHLGRHAHSLGDFDVRFFDTPKDGTP